jgi:hypothetical protein
MCQSLLILSELHPVMSKKVDYHSIDQQIIDRLCNYVLHIYPCIL